MLQFINLQQSSPDTMKTQASVGLIDILYTASFRRQESLLKYIVHTN